LILLSYLFSTAYSLWSDPINIHQVVVFTKNTPEIEGWNGLRVCWKINHLYI